MRITNSKWAILITFSGCFLDVCAYAPKMLIKVLNQYPIFTANKIRKSSKNEPITIRKLRMLQNPDLNTVYHTNDLGGGNWIYDFNDHKSLDNTGTVVVSSNGKRFKRLYDDVIDVKWFGVNGDGTDETEKLQKAMNNSRFKTLRFDASKTYLAGGGNHFLTLKTGDIILDGNGCKINPYYKGGGTVFFINDRSASAIKPVTISNITVKNFDYDAGYGQTIFLRNNSQPYLKFSNINIVNNKFKNFSGFASIGVITFYGADIIKPDQDSQSCKSIVISNNRFENFGKFLGIILNKDHNKGDKFIEVTTLDKTQTLNDKILIGGYFRIASAEENLNKPNDFSGTNSIYKVTRYDSTSLNSGILHFISGTYSDQKGYNADAENMGLSAPVKVNASILPIIRWINPTISYCPKFNFIPGKAIAQRSSNSQDENNRSHNLLNGQEFYISHLSGPLYKIMSIDQSGAITLDRPFSSETSKQYDKTVITAGSMGNMIFIAGNVEASIIKNIMIGGERAINGSIPLMHGTTMNDNKTSLIISDNYIKGFYFPVEFGNDPFLTTIRMKYTINKGDNYFLIDNAFEFSYAATDINADGLMEHLLAPSKLVPQAISFGNSLIEGDVIQFYHERGLYIITNIPKDFNDSKKIEISRYDENKGMNVSGGFFNSAVGFDYVTAYKNIPLKLSRQWNKLSIYHNIFEDTYNSLLSVGCFNTKIENNTFNGIQNMTCELWCMNASIENNTFNNTRWKGDANRIGVSGSWANIDLRGPLLNSTSNLYFANNIINTVNTQKGQLSGQNTFTSTADNPGSQIFMNNTFNGISGYVFKPQQSENINSRFYSSTSYYKLIVFKGNTFNINLLGNIGNFLCLNADTTEIINNTFNFVNGNVYSRIFSTPEPNPKMYEKNEFKIFINGNRFLNAKVEEATIWGGANVLMK